MPDTPTITVPRQDIGQLIVTIAKQVSRDGRFRYPEAGQAFRDVINTIITHPPTAEADTIDTEAAWWLMWESTAMLTYNLDECADETYGHPAVQAEINVQFLIEEQAPELSQRLWGEVDRHLRDGAARRRAAELGPDAQTVTF